MSTLTVSDYLVDFEKLLKEEPDFKLVGRDGAIDSLSHILVQEEASNVLIYGETGVGMTSIVKGLTSRKSDNDKPLPLDIAARRFTWLDVNKMFATGDEQHVLETFQAVLDSLKKSHNRVLVIDDFRDFLDGVESMSNKRMMNMMMSALKKKDFQAMWICRREHASDVLKCHSDVKEVFTPYEVKEPPKEEILEIARSLTPKLESHHRIVIDPKAVTEAVNLLTQYRGAMTFRAQPFRTLHLLDKAAGNKQLSVRNRAPGLENLEKQLASVTTGLVSAKPEDRDLLEQRKVSLESDIAEKSADWAAHREEIRKQTLLIGESEEKLDAKRRALDAKLEEAKQKNDDLKASGKKPDEEKAEPSSNDRLLASIGLSGDFDSGVLVESKDVRDLRNEIRVYEDSIPKLNAKLLTLSEKYSSEITLTKEDIQKTFSDESSIPLKKLSANETEKYLNAEKELGEMVFGQDEAIKALSGAIRSAKAGLKEPNKPIGSYLFIGPSGVGKTELAKALALFLHGDMRSFNKFDMSEYQDKAQATRLTGAPPGTVGYEEGGTLTNAMQRNPYSVNCFDELEKANSAVYDLFLQVFDEGRLTDNHGIVADFSNAVNICTTNFGGKHFLRDDITFEQANEIVQKALYNGDEYFGEASPFRPEFLNRFSGIVCFNRLGDEVVLQITNKKIKDLAKMVTTAKPHLNIEMAPETVRDFSKAFYTDPAKGARVITDKAIPKLIKDPLATIILRDQMEQQLKQGDSEIEHEPDARTIRISFSKEAGITMDVVAKDTTGAAISVAAAVNTNQPVAASPFASAAIGPK